MRRPLALLGVTVLAALAAVVPAAAADAAVQPQVTASTTALDSAVWVDHSLRVVYSWQPPLGPASDSWTSVSIDGKRLPVAEDVNYTNRVVTIPRSASAGPAHVEIVSDACVDGTEGYTCTPTTVFSATVRQHVAKAKPGQVSAYTMLDRLKVAKESHAATYARSRFRLWIDADHDGESTRAEVLRSESSVRVTENARHTVTKGRWVSPYDGTVVTAASKLDINHLVPLEEAWTSGAATWSATKRTAYANDLGYGASLIAVSQHANRSKGDKEPNAYLPARKSFVCAYVRDWIAVKYRWGLRVDAAEKAALQADLARSCTNLFVKKPGKPNLTALVGTTSGSGGGTSKALDPRYATCTELLKHPNHAPYRRGVDPEYAWYQDRDHDGLVCE